MKAIFVRPILFALSEGRWSSGELLKNILYKFAKYTKGAEGKTKKDRALELSFQLCAFATIMEAHLETEGFL